MLKLCLTGSAAHTDACRKKKKNPCLVFWSSFAFPYVLRLKPRSPCLQLQIGQLHPVVFTTGHTQSLQWGKKQLRMVVCRGCHGWCIVVSSWTRRLDTLHLEHFVGAQGITVCLPCIICQAFGSLMKLSFCCFFPRVLLSGSIITTVFFFLLLIVNTNHASFNVEVSFFVWKSESKLKESILWEVREGWSLCRGQEREWEGGKVITEVS